MIDILKELAATKCVEFLATPYAYSLASEYNEA
jgi:alpha-amylase/alpha-mannosidase (GH57 family)